MATATVAPTTVTAGPAPSSVTIASTAVVCIECTLEGPYAITIGEHAVIHPKATLKATNGPIMIGAHCIVEEFTLIQATEERGVTIGSHTLIEVGARVEAVTIGEATLIEPRAVLAPLSVVGSGCTIGACTSVATGEVVEDETVQWGTAHQRRRHRGGIAWHRGEIVPKIELLHEILTKTHKLRR